jgi:hypothetical protein
VSLPPVEPKSIGDADPATPGSGKAWKGIDSRIDHSRIADFLGGFAEFREDIV